MRNNRWFASMVLASGLTMTGAPTLAAAPDWNDRRDARQERVDSRELRRDNARVEQLRAEIARVQWRLNNNRRLGLRRAAEQDVRELARNQRKLDLLLAEIRRDERDLRRNSFR